MPVGAHHFRLTTLGLILIRPGPAKDTRRVASRRREVIASATDPAHPATHGPPRVLPPARRRSRPPGACRVRLAVGVAEGPPRRGDGDGPRGRALHPRGDREGLSRTMPCSARKTAPATASPAPSRIWIIDPIDGTANYARSIAHYCVSIGYVEHGVPTVGALHDPSHERLYYAERGGGAWMTEGGGTAAAPGRQPGRRRSMRRPSSAAGRCAGRRPTTWRWSTRAQRRLCVSPRRLGRARAWPTWPPGASRAIASCTSTRGTAPPALLLVTEAGGRINDFFAGNGLTRRQPARWPPTARWATPSPAWSALPCTTPEGDDDEDC